MDNPAVGEYVVGLAPGSDKKTLLIKVEGITKGVAHGPIQKDAHVKDKMSIGEIPVGNLLINLGKDPRAGKVYGHDVGNLYRGKRVHPDFGTLYYMYAPEKSLRDDFDKALTRAYKTLKQADLDFIVQTNTTIWEIQPFTGGKYAGMYKRSSNVEKNPHRIQLKPEAKPEEATEENAKAAWPYYIYHELGHHFHSEFMTGKKLNAQWVKLYNASIRVTDVPSEECEAMLNDLLSQEDVPSAFKANLDEEKTAFYQNILKFIKREHGVSVKELDILFEADYKDEIRGVWPVNGLTKKDLEPLVSEYGLVNYRELLADSFAFYLMGKKLPKQVQALMEKSISYAKANRER